MGWRDRLLELLGLRPKSSMPAPEGSRDGAPAERPLAARRKVTAVIGLDLGTSCSKCVIGVTGRQIAVPFRGLTSAETPYLLPTQLWLGSDRSLSLRRSDGAWPIVGIKVGLMESADRRRSIGGGSEATAVVLGAAYIGEALRHARDWLLSEKRDLLGEAELSWELNIGLPAKSHDDRTVSDAFRRAAHAGWALSHRNGPTYLGVAIEAVRAVTAKPDALEGFATINLVPEVAAEVVGYARSAQKREGPHLMVDIGATTVDICLFQLSEEEEGYSYAFYATDVRTDLGAFRLHEQRRKAIDPSAEGLGLSNLLEPIPASFRDYPGANGAAEEVDRRFGNETETMVRGVAWRAKQKQRSGLVAEEEKRGGIRWIKSDEIRVLMCGGGSRLPLYVDAVRQAGRALAPGGATGLHMKRFGIVPGLEYPRRLDAPGLRHAFHRIAVAYGLSYSVDNIGRFTPPSELAPEPPWWRVEFEDRRPEND
jgi:hypothetical protein